MVDFSGSKKFKTSESAIKVDPGLPVGSYRFQLVVTDADGNHSKPALLNLAIVDGPILRDPRLVDPITREPVSPIGVVTPVIPTRD